MAKRKPISQLNDRNWNDVEEEPEDAGMFQSAQQDILNSRVIRKARRTLACSDGEKASSVFAGFALKAPASSSFKPDPSHGLLSNSAALSNTRSIVASNGANDTVEDTEDTIDDDTSFAGSPAYLQQLRQLNEAILAWVERHVKHSPYCIFTPSFDDYNRHLQDLRNEWCARGTPLSACITSAADDHTPVTSVDRCPLPQTTKTPSAEFSFSIGSSASKTGFKFDQCFSSSLQKECVSGEGDDDDNYVPPTEQVHDIKEEGSVYSKRCKLFYQKSGQWADRGMGNLHLKVTESKRTQLIVRADTILGNILLNIMLTPSIPTKRHGKNNVSLVCSPNPPLEPGNAASHPVSMLLRVKSGEEADELLNMLDRMKA